MERRGYASRVPLRGLGACTCMCWLLHFNTVIIFQVRKHLKAEFENLLLEGTSRVSSEAGSD